MLPPPRDSHAVLMLQRGVVYFAAGVHTARAGPLKLNWYSAFLAQASQLRLHAVTPLSPSTPVIYRFTPQRPLLTRAGTLISIHYFEVNFPAEEAGGGWFHYFPDIPVVPTVCLAISALINLYGNRVGMMPLE